MCHNAPIKEGQCRRSQNDVCVALKTKYSGCLELTSVCGLQLFVVLNLRVTTLLHLFQLTLTTKVGILRGFPSVYTIYVSNISL